MKHVHKWLVMMIAGALITAFSAVADDVSVPDAHDADSTKLTGGASLSAQNTPAAPAAVDSVAGTEDVAQSPGVRPEHSPAPTRQGLMGAKPIADKLKVGAEVNLMLVSGGGAAIKVRLSDQFDIVVGGYGEWKDGSFGFYGETHLLIPTSLPVHIFPFVGYGYHLQQLEHTHLNHTVEQALDMSSVTVGAGFEKSFEPHAFALEIGFCYARTEYDKVSRSTIGTSAVVKESAVWRRTPLTLTLGYTFFLPFPR